MEKETTVTGSTSKLPFSPAERFTSHRRVRNPASSKENSAYILSSCRCKKYRTRGEYFDDNYVFAFTLARAPQNPRRISRKKKKRATSS